ncbi:MAG: DUF4469 domain-containing protein [Treponematales bacterium]
MAIINDVNEVLHRIRAKLYPSYLSAAEGWIARTQAEAPLSIEDVAASAKNRGGYTGSYEDLVEHVKVFLDEAVYNLADGFSIQMGGWFSIHPHISGLFAKPTDPPDPVKNRLGFSFRERAELRNLAGKTAIEIEGVADTSGYIGRVIDIHTSSIDDVLSPGKVLSILGSKIKVQGDDPEVGVFFVSAADGTRTKVTEALSENGHSKVNAEIPAALPAGGYRVEIVTRYSGSGTPLKELRTVTYQLVLTVPEAAKSGS